MRPDRAIIRATAEARAQFYDCDPMGVVWHGNYPRFLELGRVAVLHAIDYEDKDTAAIGAIDDKIAMSPSKFAERHPDM